MLDANDKIEEIVSTEIIQLVIITVITLTILLFIIIITMIGFNRLIKKQLPEFGIHMLCGASARKLIIRFALLVYLILLISLICVSISLNSYQEFLLIFSFALLLGLIILIYPYYKMKNLKCGRDN